MIELNNKWNVIHYFIPNTIFTKKEDEDFCKRYDISLDQKDLMDRNYLDNVSKYNLQIVKDCVYRQKLTEHIYKKLGIDAVILFMSDYTFESVTTTISEIKKMRFEPKTLIVHPEYAFKEAVYKKVGMEDHLRYIDEFKRFILTIISHPNVACLVGAYIRHADREISISPIGGERFYKENNILCKQFI